jgi:hypothetical protein
MVRNLSNIREWCRFANDFAAHHGWIDIISSHFVMGHVMMLHLSARLLVKAKKERERAGKNFGEVGKENKTKRKRGGRWSDTQATLRNGSVV